MCGSLSRTCTRAVEHYSDIEPLADRRSLLHSILHDRSGRLEPPGALGNYSSRLDPEVRSWFRRASALSQISVEWIPAHCGFGHHDAADRLARQAATHAQNRSIHVGCFRAIA